MGMASFFGAWHTGLTKRIGQRDRHGIHSERDTKSKRLNEVCCKRIHDILPDVWMGLVGTEVARGETVALQARQAP